MHNDTGRRDFFGVTRFLGINSIEETRKNRNVETLRGIAIILVVFGHMIGYTSSGGMRVSDDSFLRYVYYSLEYIRLPLFTVISGWVYANKPVADTGNRRMFLKGKLRRLLIPMFVVSTLLFTMRMVVPGTNTTPDISALPRNLFLPYDVYWYLFSLFLIFVAVSLLDTKAFFREATGWFSTLVIAFILLFVSENYLDAMPNIFSFKGALYLFPFFLIGIGIFRYRYHLLNSRVAYLTFVVFAVAVVIQQLAWFGLIPLQERHSVLGMTVGVSAALLLFRMKYQNDLLIWIGGHAYGIFLFHVFFTGGSRIVLTRLGIENPLLVLCLGVIAAIILSIVVERAIRLSPFLRFCILGLRRENPSVSLQGGQKSAA